MDVIEELKSFWENSQKKISGGGGSVWGGVRVDVNEELKFLCKFKKKKLGWGREGEGSGLGGQGGCDRRIEKFLGKFTKKNFRGGGVGLGWGQGGCE